MQPITSLVIDQIKNIVKTGKVFTGRSDLYSFSFDASFGTHLPELAVQSESVKEVSEIIKLANKLKFPVYPRGHATSLSGGPLPVRGGLVLDCSQWNKKLEINPKDMTAIVSPGVITSNIDEAARVYGLMYPPDPSSSHISTIGGNLAENSGGPKCVKYGVTKDYVLGLEVVTPEGEIIKTGGSTIKNVTGYDLTKLIVGSEGTLGVITEAILKLVPAPPSTQTMLVVFDDLISAGEAISNIMVSGVLPSKLELMDQNCIKAVEDFQPMGLPTDAEAILLIELDGHLETIKNEVMIIQSIFEKAGVHNINIAKNEQEATKMWQARKLVSPAIIRHKPTKISEDITVPLSRIPEMFKSLQRIREEFNVDLVVFGHAGDGNLHPNIVADERNVEEMKRVEGAVQDIFKTAINLGGTLSGEHGIGTMKASFMELELGKTGVDMMMRIKEAWDPNNIMNPGKIFPEHGERFVLRNE